MKDWQKLFGRLSRASAISLLINGIAIPVACLLQLVQARVMSVTENGTVQYALSWVVVLGMFATCGMDYLSLRIVPQYFAKGESALIRGIVRFTILCGAGISILIGVCIGIIFYLYFGMGRELSLLSLSTLLLIIWTIGTIRQSILRGLHKVASARAPEIVVRPLLIIVFLLIASTTYQSTLSAQLVITLQVIASFIALLIGLILLFRSLPPTEENDGSKCAYQLSSWLKEAFPFMILSGLLQLLSELDKIILGITSSTYEVGLYSVAARIALLGLFTMQAIEIVAAPLFSEYYTTRSKIELQKLASNVALIIFLSSLAIIIPLLIFSHTILSLFGAAYTEAESSLIILTFAFLIQIVYGSGGFLLSMTERQNQLLQVVITVLPIAIIIYLPLTYFYHGVGAAWGMLIITFLRCYLIRKKAIKTLNVDPTLWASLKSYSITE